MKEPRTTKAMPVRSFEEQIEAMGERQIGGIILTKVVHEHVPIIASDTGHNSIGSLIDRQLAQQAKEGVIIQAIKLEVDEEFWQEVMGPMYRERHNY
jgi:hypothetical protein